MYYLLLENLSTFQIKLNKAQFSKVEIGQEGLQSFAIKIVTVTEPKECQLPYFSL